jgi:hypothetical protein
MGEVEKFWAYSELLGARSRCLYKQVLPVERRGWRGAVTVQSGGARACPQGMVAGGSRFAQAKRAHARPQVVPREYCGRVRERVCRCQWKRWWKESCFHTPLIVDHHACTKVSFLCNLPTFSLRFSLLIGFLLGPSVYTGASVSELASLASSMLQRINADCFFKKKWGEPCWGASWGKIGPRSELQIRATQWLCSQPCNCLEASTRLFTHPLALHCKQILSIFFYLLQCLENTRYLIKSPPSSILAVRLQS